jgi:hypothetical protein
MSDFGLRIGVEGAREIPAAFQRLREKCDLPNMVFHSLRHSSTTYKFKLNKEIETQRDKVSTLRAALDNTASSFGEKID